VCDTTNFVHHNLKQLTLIKSITPWNLILRSPTGHQFFNQLTHLRVSGGTSFIIPDFCFSSLTHLSFSCHQVSFGPSSPFTSARFPVLQHIVPSLPYMVCRDMDPMTLRTAGHAIDPRIDVLACPKKWKEVDVWQSVMDGAMDLWARARTDEYLRESHAFKQE